MVYEARMMRVALSKMHGARNDFIIVDQRGAALADINAFARWACDRHTGVGADGLIALEPSERGLARMRTVNADGSEAEMCGNGIRCAARWLDEAGEGASVCFETEAGIIPTEIVAREPEYLVRVAMGRPRIVSHEAFRTLDGVLVDVGNPHLVFFVDDAAAVDLAALVATIARDGPFSTGVNVHVATRLDERTLRARHWERGVGLTQACGTGAVACAAVALDRRLTRPPVVVMVPGGRLVVEWDGGGEAYLVGPAVRVFDTEIPV